MTADDTGDALFEGWSAQDVLDWFERQPDEIRHEMSQVLTATDPEAQIAFIRRLRHIANDPAFSGQARQVAREVLRLIMA